MLPVDARFFLKVNPALHCTSLKYLTFASCNSHPQLRVLFSWVDSWWVPLGNTGRVVVNYGYGGLNAGTKSAEGAERSAERILAVASSIFNVFPWCNIQLVLFVHAHLMVSSQNRNMIIWMLNPHSQDVVHFSGKPTENQTVISSYYCITR